MDAYYLALERAYRVLYKRAVDGHATTWELDVSKPRPGDLAAAFRSPAIAVLYGSSLLTAAIIGTYLLLK